MPNGVLVTEEKLKLHTDPLKIYNFSRKLKNTAQIEVIIKYHRYIHTQINKGYIKAGSGLLIR